jgi:hypothetical protein
VVPNFAECTASSLAINSHRSQKSYNHNDAQPLAGDNYYRIKAISMDSANIKCTVKEAAQKKCWHQRLSKPRVIRSFPVLLVSYRCSPGNKYQWAGQADLPTFGCGYGTFKRRYRPPANDCGRRHHSVGSRLQQHRAAVVAEINVCFNYLFF